MIKYIRKKKKEKYSKIVKEIIDFNLEQQEHLSVRLARGVLEDLEMELNNFVVGSLSSTTLKKAQKYSVNDVDISDCKNLEIEVLRLYKQIEDKVMKIRVENKRLRDIDIAKEALKELGYTNKGEC